MNLRELGSGMMRAVASCCGDVAPDDACQRCALLIDAARTLLASKAPALSPDRRLIGYRVAVAAREDHRAPPPHGHLDWLRVTRPQSPGFEGLAEQRDVAKGFVFLTRRAAQWEADAWAEHWHARIVTVWRRGRDA